MRDARHLAIHGALMAQRYFHGPLLKDVPGIDDPNMKNCGIVPGGGFHSSYISFLKMQRAYEQRGMGDRVKYIPLLSSTAKMAEELNAFQSDMIGCYPSFIRLRMSRKQDACTFSPSSSAVPLINCRRKTASDV